MIQRALLLWATTAAVASAFSPAHNQRHAHFAATTTTTTTTTTGRAVKNWRRPSFQPLAAANNGDQETTLTDNTTTMAKDNVAFDKALQEGKLRQAVQYLQDHPDMQVSRQRWDAIFAGIEERTANADESALLNAAAAAKDGTSRDKGKIAEFPMQSAARQEMTDMYLELKKKDKLRLFGAVSSQDVPAAGSTNLAPELLEQILELPIKALTPQPTNSLLLAGVAVAAFEGLISASLNIPLNVLALSTLLLAVLDRLFVNGAVSESFLKIFSPGINRKVLRHEAGHFLVAYLLGCPVEGIVLSAWAALQDRRFGNRQVSAGTSFFDPDLSRQINTNGKVTRASINRYSMIVMAGIAAEADSYGRADGGAGDEQALVAFLSQLNAASGGAANWTSDKIRNQARWGALQSVLMLREYKASYEALVDALERGGNLGDCVHAIERAARENNLQPLQKPLGYIVDGPDGKGMWTTQDPAALAVSTATEQGAKKIEADKAKVFDEQESLAALKEYKSVMEERLRKLDAQLNENKD